MANTTYLKIRNWERWQSYRKDRGQPPWIKIHREVMRNYEWLTLTDAQRGQLVCIWVLAADREGFIPANPRALQKICSLDSEPDLQLFVDLGFIEAGANVAPPRRQGDAKVTPGRRHDDASLTPQKQVRSRSEEEAPPARARASGPGAEAEPFHPPDLTEDQSPEAQLIASGQPATADQLDQVAALQETTGCQADDLLPDHYRGQPLTKRSASVAIDRLMAERDRQRARARGSPTTFAQAREEATNDAFREVIRRRQQRAAGDPDELGSGDDGRVEVGSADARSGHHR